jgi:CSLREA domain-containing protein
MAFPFWRNGTRPQSRSSLKHRKRSCPFFRPLLEELEKRTLLSTYVVNSIGDAPDGDVTDGIADTGDAKNGYTGICTLRAAILQANYDGGGTILFSIGGGPRTIAPATPLPPVTVPITIDGTTQPGFSGSPIIVLDGSRQGAGYDGLVVLGGNSTVKGLVVQGVKGINVPGGIQGGSGIALDGGGGDTLTGNYLGTDLSGSTARGNTFGVTIGCPNNTIGGTTTDLRNLISGNDSIGLYIIGGNASGNVVKGNYIGTDITGMTPVRNYYGVLLTDAPNNQVGGSDPGALNLLSGNNQAGVGIFNPGSTGNLVQGNWIGTDKTGMAALGNTTVGVVIAGGASQNVVGTNGDGMNDAAELNVISGNAWSGVAIGDRANGNVVAGNYIGTDKSGAVALGNGNHGVDIFGGAISNRIGTNGDGVSDDVERNIISGNSWSGVAVVDVGTDFNVVAGNYIGTDLTGTQALGNGENGVVIATGAAETQVGSSPNDAYQDAERNVIAANGWVGVAISDAGTTSNTVGGNYIGTDVSGSVAMGNGIHGVSITGGATDNFIGAPDPMATAQRNVIAASKYDGVYLGDASTSGNVVSGNYIGTEKTGTRALANGANGVEIGNGATDNQIGVWGAGRLGPGAPNLISGNTFSGVYIHDAGTTGNQVGGNYIGTDVQGKQALGNGNLGVWLGLGAQNNRIGTDGDGISDDLERNIISGNAFQGVGIFDAGTNNNAVAGNYIGTDVTGTAALGNGNCGIWIKGGAQNNVIGTDGQSADNTAEANVISANAFQGVAISDAGTNNNAVAGNYIGTDVTGTQALGNHQNGVSISGGAQNNVIGTDGQSADNAAEANVISANAFSGVNIQDASTNNNVVAGNFIGTDKTGTQALGNGNSGVVIDQGAQANVVGTNGDGVGDDAEHNVISGNAYIGVYIGDAGTNQNVVAGNFVGTDLTGTQFLPNGTNAVWVNAGAQQNRVGTNGDGISDDLERNIITADNYPGLTFGGPGTNLNVAAGNFIGTDVTGTMTLGNLDHGVFICNGAQKNRIGTDADGVADDAERNVISGASSRGVWITDAGTNGNVVAGNYIGTDVTGTIVLGNGGEGVLIAAAAQQNVIGTDGNGNGFEADARNVIAGSGGEGVLIQDVGTNKNVVAGNYIGTDVTGTIILGNGGNGVKLVGGATMNRIGTNGDGVADAAERNLISGNDANGVLLLDADTIQNTVAGNFIGTDVSGTLALPNNGDGVRIEGAPSNTIGGAGNGLGNVISGNSQNGVEITDVDAPQNLVQGNFIGTDATGTMALANALDGVLLDDAPNNTIGGMAAGAGNVISGNVRHGIEIQGAAAVQNQIQGNYIGTDATGSVALGNGLDGIFINAVPNITIGGVVPPARNVISANGQNGIEIQGAAATPILIEGNYVGTDATGAMGLGNGRDGVLINGVPNLTIGGLLNGAGNVISGNLGNGIDLTGAGTTQTQVQANYIGTNAQGNAAVGNAKDGVRIDGVPNTTIGGLQGGSQNVISGNLGNGIHIQGAAAMQTVVQYNLIGTDSRGFDAVGNGLDGILNEGAPNVTIGGLPVAAGNVLSGNGKNGIHFTGATATPAVIQGNVIGADLNDAASIRNIEDGVRIDGVPNLTIGGLVPAARNFISGNLGNGIEINGVAAMGTQIQGNYIGTDAGGAVAVGNGKDGVLIVGAPNTTIGGLAAGALNVISGNGGNGIDITLATATPTVVQGNWIGTDANGARAVANGGDGVLIDGVPRITIGGLAAGAGNTISGNFKNGIEVNGAAAVAAQVQGNFLGTDMTGTIAVGNGQDGVLIQGAPNATIGGIAAGAGNVISGNQQNGVEISGQAAAGNQVVGNMIGADVGGFLGVGNQMDGVLINGAPNNTVGAPVPGGRNVISDNQQNGVEIRGPQAANNLVQANFIGTTDGGGFNLGNNGDGVLIKDAPNNTIGGGAAAARNVISGNTQNGVEINGNGARNNQVQGNFIGTKDGGMAPLGNLLDGVLINGAPNNTIGGPAAVMRNVISSNFGNGVEINGPGATKNQVQGNFIGTDDGGNKPLGNFQDGVRINSAPSNTVGGRAALDRNVISANGANGVEITGAAATLNVVLGNFIGTQDGGNAPGFGNPPVGNAGDGARIDGAPANTIGDNAGAGNVIGSNGKDGVHILNAGATGNLVQGNWIGTNAGLVATLPNGQNGVEIQDASGNFIALPGNEIRYNTLDGVRISGTSAFGNLVDDNTLQQNFGNGVNLQNAPDNTIGGAGNRIYLNQGDGVLIQGSAASGNQLQGNLIGTDGAGANNINALNGVEINGAPGNTVGGVQAANVNIIADNGLDGVYIVGAAATGNLVQGNFIGTDPANNGAIGNIGEGVDIEDAPNNVIGGPGAARNIISGNQMDGVYVVGGGASGNLVQNNFIGTDNKGMNALPNAQRGVLIQDAPGNFIGGSWRDGTGNLLSGNGINGITIAGNGAIGNQVAGNFIGTDVLGTGALPNSNNGAAISDAPGNVIGGPGSGANLISGNANFGVLLTQAGATGNVVQNNYIGTDLTGANALPNGSDGLVLRTGASNNTIGSAAAGLGNLISGNTFVGVHILQSAGANLVEGNFIGTDIHGTQALPNSVGVLVDGAANNTIGGTTDGARNVISGNGGPGVYLSTDTATGNLVEGNYIGVDVTGTQALGNGDNGVRIVDAPSNQIGGMSVESRNVISGNSGDGVRIAGGGARGNRVLANLIGTNAAGNAKVGNSGNGVSIQDAPNTVGGGTLNSRSVISGNGANGVLVSGQDASGSVVQGNDIGTVVTGGAALGNALDGVSVQDSSLNIIGGSLPGTRNVIGGNGGNGVTITGQASIGNEVEGNYLGIDATGTVKLGNTLNGLSVQNAPGTLIGGTKVDARNVISGNTADGIVIAGANATQILGNFIGTNGAGTAALGNGGNGVNLQSGQVTIGGAGAGTGNVISGNGADGVLLGSGATGIPVQGNYVGTDLTGSVAVGNGTNGVEVGGSGAALSGNVISGNHGDGVLLQSTGAQVQGNFVGTTVTGQTPLGNGTNGVEIKGTANTVGAGNIISANGMDGVLIGANATLNAIQGNSLGTDATGVFPLGNHANGVEIDGASANSVGGATAGAGNVIAFNGGDGVLVRSSGLGNTIRRNAIRSSGGLGINLQPDGEPDHTVTPNDVGDGDGGPNGLQNFPLLASVSSSGGVTTISGSLNSSANATFTLEFFANTTPNPSGFGEGQTYLGSTPVATGGDGNTNFVAVFAVAVPASQFVTATATDAGGSTSEFSADQAVSSQSPVADAGGPYTLTEGAALTLDASRSSDPDGDALSYSWTIDGHAGAATGVSPTLTWAQLQSLGVAEDGGPFSVSVQVDDGHGDVVASPPTTLTVTDAPLTVTGQDLTTTELSSTGTVAVATFTDPGGPEDVSEYSATIDWGDGSPTTAGTLTYDPSTQVFTVTGAHTYASDDAYTVTVSVAENAGAGTATATATVSPVPPTLSLSGESSVEAGSTYTLNLSGMEVSTDTIGQWDVNWGDGNVETFTGNPASATHTYYQAAECTISAQATDEDGTFDAGNTLDVTVNPAAASTLVVSGFPTFDSASEAHAFTVTAQDPYGNIATGYTGTIHFSSSDRRAALPRNYTFTSADASVHTFSATLSTAGTQSLTVTDTTTASINGTESGIVVQAAASVLVVAGFPNPTTAGVAQTFTVTAEEANGDIATAYVGTVRFTSSDRHAALPANYTFTLADAGVHTFTATLKSAGTQVLTATDNARSTVKGAEPGIVVSPATTSTLTVTGFPSPTVAGGTHTFTVTARDAYGNVTPAYTGTVAFSSSDRQADLPGSYTFTATDAGVQTFSATLKTAGSRTLTATDTTTSSITGKQGTTVQPASPSLFLVTGFPTTTTAGIAHNVRVVVKDAYGNTVTGYRGTVHFTSSDPQAALPDDYTFTAADAGTHTFSAALKTASPQSLSLMDTALSSLTGAQSGIAVKAAAASVLILTGFPLTTSAGVAQNFTVTLQDVYGNIATGYRGRIHFTSSDGQAVLPLDYTFKAADAGTHVFSATLKTKGTQSLTATDTLTSGLTGSELGIIVQ